VKILYFTRDYTTHDRRFLVALAAAGHEVWFLRLEDDGFVYETRPLPEGVTEVQWAGGRTPARHPEDWLRLLPDLERVIEEVQPDLVHAGPVPSCGFMAALTSFRPLLVMSWGSDLLVDAVRDPALGFAARYALRRADGLVCDCDAVRERATDLAGGTLPPVVQFPWGVDLDQFQPSRAADRGRSALGIGDGFVVVSTRLWETSYGIETLLESVRLARRTVPSLQLLLLGDGSLRDQVRTTIEAPDLAGAVLTPGLVSPDQLPAYFQAADVYLSCTTSDGSSISLLEAMACGLPVVVADTPGNREWVTNADAGQLVPVGDAVRFAAALVDLAARSDADRVAAGATHREIAKARANWSANVQRLMDTYSDLTRTKDTKEMSC
jgi:glycosyltransferase involved in cell wall biosynthesis